ncbi:flagellar protein FlaG protein [Desulfonatronospira thiodismutans ASO3-1]|uniref:Flagellar protein FlaG protein n=1 Tax=Desulfonatronospira thiodismutans ASO3-1 TaxID=555779 RepID=D6ST44_9BACT|nr:MULTISPECIES: flagellar protein FlaG [Desulfonatronospira]EFI33860.1 flagellar protein FlaG protein [Desulfonatronospira thiodismutans ASO3-1]RQD78600.1 MAG: flagellar protein FlaG [Desulfonatronospira sp. MSAO_Bac3]
MKITNFDINPLAAPTLKTGGAQPKSAEETKTIVHPQTSAQDLDEDKILGAANSIKEYMSSMGVKLNFQFQGEGESIQVEVLDPTSDKIIRKIPSDEILSLAESIEDMLGVLVNKEA